MSRPHYRVEPEVLTPHSARLFYLLRAIAHAPGVGQGCTTTASCGEARARPDCMYSSGRRLAPSLPATRRLSSTPRIWRLTGSEISSLPSQSVNLKIAHNLQFRLGLRLPPSVLGRNAQDYPAELRARSARIAKPASTKFSVITTQILDRP